MTVSNSRSLFSLFRRNRNRSGLAFALIILLALAFFEMFNYSTTEYALKDLLGTLTFAGMQWATILSLAFCAIDFAGIARLFTPESERDEPKEVWYLFGAWLLAATMNAALTWWGVSMAIATHAVKSTVIVDSNTVMKVVPVFVAIMVWVIRILIIGTLTLASGRILRGAGNQVQGYAGLAPSLNRARTPSPRAVVPVSTEGADDDQDEPVYQPLRPARSPVSFRGPQAPDSGKGGARKF